MPAIEIIREIDCLPPAELAEVVRYAKCLDTSRQLSGMELGVFLRTETLTPGICLVT